MSISHLAIAVRDTLRTALNATNWERLPFECEEIEVVPGEGRPPASMGEKFIGIYGNQWEAAQEDVNRALYETLGISCTLTFRHVYEPYDRQGLNLYLQDYVGMADICRVIMASISQIPAVMTAADALSTGGRNFHEYLRWQGTDPVPIPVYSDWFGPTQNLHLHDEGGTGIMGYTMTVRFGGARRGQGYVGVAVQ